MRVRWEFGKGRAYEELAIIGLGDDRAVHFRSFTSDGKRSEGVIADVSDVHPEAIGFEARMPAGLARMAYWPYWPYWPDWPAQIRRGSKRRPYRVTGYWINYPWRFRESPPGPVS